MDRTEFWLAVTAVGGLSVAISTAIAMWLTRRHRPEANWVLAYGSGTHHVNDRRLQGTVLFNVAFSNAGDDNAFAVTFTGVSITPPVRDKFNPVIAPGEVARLTFECAVQDLAGASLVIQWIRRPTRLKRRLRHVVRLTDIPLKVMP